MAPTNTVQVQLTPAGVALAAGGTLIVSGPGYSHAFQAGQAVAVESPFGWYALQSRAVGGNLLFELAPAAPATPPAGE